ncbi:hypothetical protein J3F83DRAFT_207460 [Trichoderma novae-zelandiae]
MASPKVGYGLPARPSDGFRRRPEDSRLLSGIPKSTSRTGEKEMDVPKLVKQDSSQPRVASRVPLPSSARRPSPSTTQQSAPKAIPDRHSKSWGSATSSSGYTRSHTQTESGSSSSSRSFDSSSRLGQNVPRRTKPSPSPEAGSLLSGAANLGSSSPRRQSQVIGMDSALGIQFDRGITASPTIVQKEEPPEVSKPVGQSPVIYPELDRYRYHDRARSASNRQVVDVPYRLATHDLPPPTPGSLLFSANSSQVSAISGSPSTRFSASPGPGSYSRDTTPTSISSQSPGLIVPSRAFPVNKFRQHSPAFTRPPVTRRRTGSISNEVDSISVDPHGLAAVRESLTSSSSSSTVKGSVKNPKKERKGGKSLAAPPPSPPPRKSSQKYQTSEDEDELSPRQKRQPGIPRMTVPSPPKPGLPLRNHQSPSPQAMPPRRPSRDGISDLKSQLFTPIPVIQSSLALRAANLERRDSETTIPHPSQPGGLQSNKSASTSNLPTADQPATSTKLASRRKLSISGPVRASGTPSPTVKASSGSRFPFFGRKKAASESTANDKDKKEKQKVLRKGPAAGTGHEGYGRLGAIRRRSGIIAAPQVSNESLVSGDSFLADRINPVVIAGGAIVENRNASAELIRSESNLSLTTNERPSIDSVANSTTSSASRVNVPGPGLWPSAIPRERNQMPSVRRPSDDSDTGGAAMQTTLAYRRSVQRLKSFPDDPLQLPGPINTSGMISSPLTSLDTSILSDESSLFNLRQLPAQVLSNNHPAPKKLQKKPRSPRKWNFFSRSNNQPKPSQASEPVAVTVQPVEKKPVAFYTIMDSPEQEAAEPDLKEILREADAYARSSANVETPEVPAEEAHAANTSHLQPQTNALPEPCSPVQDHYPAMMEPAFPRMEEAIPPPAVTLSSGKPSRLAQVGRIPQVVSNRPARPSPRSFSRPFVANQQLSLHIPPTHGVGLNPRVPNFSKPATPILDAGGGDGSTTDAGTEFSFFSEPRSHITPEVTTTQEFLAFSPRKNSDCTTSSTESCVSLNYAEATAIIPRPDDPPVDDEVWDEYNDLLGEDAVKERQSTTSSRGIPFHLENYHLKLAKEKILESPTLVADCRKLSTISDAPTASTTFSADMTERIRKAFQPHPSPTVPSPVPEVAEQKDGGHSRKPSAAESMRHSITSVRKSTQSGSSTSSGEWTPLAQVNLRVGSMTVSKWLSFGQVLFSDIRHLLVKGIESPERPSVLVIDGLGNDDWSFYAAETYSTADFFNLSPRAPLPTDVQSSASRYPLSPANHHQVQYLSQLDEFPFPSHNFNCVVYRFPAAAPESHYQNVLSEACRVLKPGGYLELSILDVDLNNMGNRGRRTIRQLKERIHETSPETNLASTADLIVRLLGKSGFSTIKAARVGVPVASCITSSDDNSQGNGSTGSKKKKSSKDQPSLAEMMRDHSPNADEGITNMVSRVGRWWYSRCYENATSHSSRKNSIWNDKALLRECEELGTSLKLMVCCARAPEGINTP